MARRVSSAKGFVHDIEHLSALSDGGCNPVLLSDRALYVLQNLAFYDATFPTRYGTITGETYVPIDIDGVFSEVYQDTINAIQGGLTMGCLDDITAQLAAIAASISGAGSGGCGGCGGGLVGEILDTDGAPDGPVPAGFGPEDAGIVDRKCKAANYIFEGVSDTLGKLELSPWEEYLSLGINTVTGLTGTMLGLAVFTVYVSLFAATSLAIATLALALVAATLDIGALKVQWDSAGQDIVDAMYNASSAQDAKDAVLSVVDAIPVNAVNRAVLYAMLPLNVFNLLWYAFEDSEAVLDGYTAPYNCGVPASPIVFNTTEGVVSGSGDLSLDNTSRVLTASYYAPSNFYLLSVGLPEFTNWSALSGFGSKGCTAKANYGVGPHFYGRVDSQSQSTYQNQATYVVDAIPDSDCTTSPGLMSVGTPRGLSVMYWRSTTPFTVTITLRSTPFPV